jgi:Leucine-rich repeat (LRR) protein
LSPDIANLASSLQYLILDDIEGLTGTIPESFIGLTNLNTLRLANTRIAGPFLEVIPQIPSLSMVDVSQSRLTGTIPSSIGTLNKLTHLMMMDSKMNLTNIPSEIGLLTNLFEFQGSSSEADGGSLPTELGNLRLIRTLVIRGSTFTGTIPTEIGLLTNCDTLILVGGQLVGNIPSEIGLLTQLSTLVVFNNELTGTLPTELGNIKGLVELSLSYNNLYGTIPSGVCHSNIYIDRDCTITDCDCCIPACVL